MRRLPDKASPLLVALLLLASPVGAEESAMAGGGPERNNVSAEKGLPAELDTATKTNVLWSVELGSEAYAGPVVAAGKVFVGTNNAKPRDPAVEGDRGVVMAFSAADGSFLWQMVHNKLAAGRSVDWPLQGVCSTPAVVGDRLYYLSNRGEVVALDTEGFRDGENDGPHTAEARKGERDADVVWTLDLAALGVAPHFMTASSPVVAGGRLFAVTGNGVGEGGKVTAPGAPSFVAVDVVTGKLLWADASPGERILEGQWGSPAVSKVKGRELAIFPGGDGWVYAFEAASGKPAWRFDANAPPDPNAPRAQGSLIAAPVVVGETVLVGIGRDPEQGASDGRLWAIDATLEGDVTGRAARWSFGGEDFSLTLSSVAVTDGVVYAPDLAGFVHALDLATGKPLWKHDAFAAIWGSPLVADGKVYVGDEDGDLAILAAGNTLKVLAEPNLGDAIYTTPTAKDGVLYVVTGSKLWALKVGAGKAEGVGSSSVPLLEESQ
ncbi:MAG TPA: PQQ-binding-like beta-propeller repeat protein [Thermoanaerobaculia bacterium]|nr:PQQ-binding-like beta-propeller repeat protein [Thermoanaerobaculia bacterium]